MKIKIVEIDFSDIKDLKGMHHQLMQKFGFPDFYGKNVNALIDCWSDLRCEGDNKTTMCDYYIELDEMVGLKIKHLSSKDHLIINHLLVAVEETNRRALEYYKIPSIHLILT